ncbi:MAG: ATP-binding cassette domain-containing protein, partial [Planctomycetes bacterium]|nr:ATP-binding cassette domain-containing protein [Planctomycetota bacterium]
LEVRRNLGYLPESAALYPDMRVDEFRHFRGKLMGRVSRGDRQRAIGRICELCWIADKRTRIVGQLSKGFRQRVALAEALLADPPVVILDEPTVGLDPHQVRQVRRIIRDLGERKTVLFSTHILSEVEEICDRVIVISRGRIVADGTRDEIVARLGGKRSYIVEIEGPRDDVATALRTVKGVTSADIRSWKGKEVRLIVWGEAGADGVEAEVKKLAGEKRWRLAGIRQEPPDLESLFVHLTSGEGENR